MDKINVLESMTLSEAISKQHQLVDVVTRYFKGHEILSMGDLGVVSGYNRPIMTSKVEAVLAEFFGQEAAILVRGAGTGAIRDGLAAIMPHQGTLLIHDAPIYETTSVTLAMMGIKTVVCNYNHPQAIVDAMNKYKPDAALIQLTRQSLNDSYQLDEVVKTIHQVNKIPILTDDNYAVMKVNEIGVQVGATLSTFSLFKLLGPEGIGCVVGQKEYIDCIRSRQYSGGSQVQGFEALEALRGLVYAPVSLAIQAQTVDDVVSRLQTKPLPGVKRSFAANAQSKVIIVEFELPIAKKVLTFAEELGAAPHPVGAESKYEFVPMFYRVSKTIRDSYERAETSMIRINPMRAGTETVLRILEEAIRMAS